MALSSPPRSVLRLGGVSFLNAQPLLHGLLSGMGNAQLNLLLAEPAVLSRKLFEDELDAALAPVAPLAVHGALDIVPGVGIGCDGPVRSVVLVSQRPIEQVEEVWLDAASRTSVILTRLVLQALRGGDEPRYCARPAREIIASASGAVGGLLIGDAALDAEGHFKYVVDLGQAWKELTGLPFVFAVWVARRDRLSESDCALLQASAEAGLSARAQIAQAWARGRGGQEQEHTRYLHECISYRLDEPALQGLHEFLRRAADARLLPRTEVRFVGAASAEEPQLRSPMEDVFERAEAGARLSLMDASRLYRTSDVRRLGRLANRLALERMKYGPSVAFLAWGRSVGGEDPVAWTREELLEQVELLQQNGVRRVVIDGPIRPGLQLEWFENLFFSLQESCEVEVHALNPDQVVALAAQDDLGLWEVLQRLRRAGLNAIHGSGARVLTDRVRFQEEELVCDSATVLDVMRLAHRAGMRTWATMELGGADQALDRIMHLLKLRDLQDETGGFLGIVVALAPQASKVDDEFLLRATALTRIVLDNVPNVQLARDVPLPQADKALVNGADGVYGAGGLPQATRSGVRPIGEKTLGES